MTKRAQGRRGRGERLLTALALALSLARCKGDKQKDTVELVLPDGSGRTLELLARSSYVEYVEVPDSANELRLTLASHDVSCEHYVAPGPDDTVVVVTLKLPPAEKPHPGSFSSTRPLAEDAGAEPVQRGHAVAVLRHGTRGYVLEPGGTLELKEVDLGRTGTVSGQLAFEFPGDGSHPASSVRGRFRARVCRTEEAPGGR